MNGPSVRYSTAAVERRCRVLELRIQLERAAVAACRTVCGPSFPVPQTQIGSRLLFLVGLVEPDRHVEVHRLAHLAVHVYRRTSDVLHGRASAPDVPDVVVNEWTAVVDEVIAVVSAGAEVVLGNERPAPPADPDGDGAAVAGPVRGAGEHGRRGGVDATSG